MHRRNQAQSFIDFKSSPPGAATRQKALPPASPPKKHKPKFRDTAAPAMPEDAAEKIAHYETMFNAGSAASASPTHVAQTGVQNMNINSTTKEEDKTASAILQERRMSLLRRIRSQGSLPARGEHGDHHSFTAQVEHNHQHSVGPQAEHDNPYGFVFPTPEHNTGTDPYTSSTSYNNTPPVPDLDKIHMLIDNTKRDVVSLLDARAAAMEERAAAWKLLRKERQELGTIREELYTNQEELNTILGELNTVREELKTSREELATTQELLKKEMEDHETTKKNLVQYEAYLEEAGITMSGDEGGASDNEKDDQGEEDVAHGDEDDEEGGENVDESLF